MFLKFSCKASVGEGSTQSIINIIKHNEQRTLQKGLTNLTYGFSYASMMQCSAGHTHPAVNKQYHEL